MTISKRLLYLFQHGIVARFRPSSHSGRQSQRTRFLDEFYAAEKPTTAATDLLHNPASHEVFRGGSHRSCVFRLSFEDEFAKANVAFIFDDRSSAAKQHIVCTQVVDKACSSYYSGAIRQRNRHEVREMEIPVLQVGK